MIRSPNHWSQYQHCEGIIQYIFNIFQRKHPSVYEARACKSISDTEQTSMDSFISHPKKYPTSDLRQKQLTDALVLFVGCDLIPFSVVDSPYFQGLLRAADPRFQMPSRKHLVGTLLRDKFREMESDVMQRLEMTHNVCLTLDIWSSRQMRSYLGISAHYILEWEMKTIVLACKRFQGRHTADNIMQEYEEIVQHFGIGDKVTNIVTDNASNMIAAFALPGFTEPMIKSVTTADPFENDGDDHLEADDLVSTDDLTEELYDVLPTEHSPCFAHSLQLVVKDGLKEAGQLNRVISKTAKLVSFIHKSTVATDILEGERRVQTACATRWNSQVKMIRSVLEIPEAKLSSLEGAPTIGAYDRNLLKDMLEILEPFEDATDCAQRQNSVSASLVIPCVRGLRIHLGEMQSKYNSNLVAALRKSLDRRLIQYEGRAVYRLASMSDPQFKLQWAADEQEKETLKAELTSKACTVIDVALPEHTTMKSSPKKRKRLFSFMDKSVAPAQPATDESLNTEITKYFSQPCLAEDSDALAFWKGHVGTFPVLSKMAMQYLAVPASSAPIERTFSIAGKVFRPDRCRLIDVNFERVMFIKCNDTTYA